MSIERIHLYDAHAHIYNDRIHHTHTHIWTHCPSVNSQTTCHLNIWFQLWFSTTQWRHWACCILLILLILHCHKHYCTHCQRALSRHCQNSAREQRRFNKRISIQFDSRVRKICRNLIATTHRPTLHSIQFINKFELIVLCGIYLEADSV